VLGEAHAVEVDDVIKRLADVITDEWQRRSKILKAPDEPKPGAETLRQALTRMVAEGSIERDPAEDKKGATYRYRNLPTASPPIGGKTGPEAS
jgi:hypothetical protein